MGRDAQAARLAKAWTESEERAYEEASSAGLEADALKAMRQPTYFYACLAAGFLALLAAMAAFAIIVQWGAG